MALGMGLLVAAGASAVSGAMSADAAKSAAATQAASGEKAIGEQRREFDIASKNLKPYQDTGKAALYKLSDYLGLGPMATGGMDAAKTAATQAMRDHMSEIGQPLDPGWEPPDSWVQEYSKAHPEIAAGAAAPTTDATGSLLKPFSFDIGKDPGYQFRLDEGTKAVENSASARGSQLSGATLKELLRYGSDYASGEYNAAFQRDQATKNQIFGQLAGTAGMGQGATTTGVQAGQATAANIGNTMTGIGNANAAGTIGGANAISGAAGGVGQAMLLRQAFANQNPGVGSVNAGVNLDFPG